GVEVHEVRLAAGDRVAGGDPYHRPLMETEHEVDVGRKPSQKRDLGRARIAEDRRHAEPPHDIEDRVANGPAGSHGICWIARRRHGCALRLVDHAWSPLPSASLGNAITYALRTIGHIAYACGPGQGEEGR